MRKKVPRKDRNKKVVTAAKKKADKKQKLEQEQQEKYHERLRKIKLKNEYIKCFVKGKWYLERCNLMIQQLNDEKVVETIDGCPKSIEYLKSEYYMTKVSAVRLMREAAWSKKQLMDDFKVTEEEIQAVHDEYLVKPIVRKPEEYDASYKRERFAEWITE